MPVIECVARRKIPGFTSPIFSLNRFGKFLAFAILALGLDLIWGYTGVLSLGTRGVFRIGRLLHGHAPHAHDRNGKCLWQRAAGFHGVEPGQIAAAFLEAVLQFSGCDLWRDPGADVFALVFGFLAFRSRIRGVYFAIITQALALVAWLVFNRNETNLGGTNGLTDFKQLLGFRLSDPGTQRALYVLTVLCLGGAYFLCRWIIRSRAGRVLIAVRDSEQRVVFSGYTPANYKLFVFVVSAASGRIGRDAVCPASRHHHAGANRGPAVLEMVIWVAVGGRGTSGGSGTRGSERESWPQRSDQLFSGTVAVHPRRALRRGGAVVPRWAGWHDANGKSHSERMRKAAEGESRCVHEEAAAMSDHGSIIYLEGVIVDYDGFKALNNLNFIVNYNELRVVIGPNGAGKTTLLDVICGKTKPAAGRVIFGKDQELIGKREDEIVKLGIGRKFQAPSIYGNLTVWENLDLSFKRPSKGVFSTLFGKSTAEEREEDRRER